MRSSCGRTSCGRDSTDRRRAMPRGITLALVACVAVLFAAAGSAAEGGGRGRPPLPSAEEIAKLPPDGGPDYNRLIFEKSPYLLQHAANPVDWYPWGEAAFERARAENKPVFLSVGYSTCHWCHVMEVESFEDPGVAALLNKDFIAIKVDREERPDVDHIYMRVTQALTGGGGWPMTIVMGPDKRPFFAGTYFPRTGRLGRPGMMELLPALADAWVNNRADIDDTTAQIDAFLAGGRGAAAEGAAPAEVGAAELETAYRQLAERYDPEHGGFGTAPKFPSPHSLLFLMRYAHRSGDGKALEMVERTLQAMRAGGLFDHVGLGFHRYSTDAGWRLPHFEKMLYDQAMLAMAYTEAWQATGKAEYARTVREILAYVSRELTAPEGGFYSAQDADSEGEEGKFYLWTEAEARGVLGEEDAGLFLRVYGFEKDGNFKDEASGEKTGRNIPHRDRSDKAWAAELGIEPGRLAERLESARSRLFEARERRAHPFRDDKILTDWNGLMIAAYAQAARALDEPQYAEAAERAADFVLANLRDGRGRLLKRYRGGEGGLPAHLDDYAFFVWGLIELYETSFDAARLETALELNDAMIEHYADPEGGFFITADDGEELLVRPREYYDGAIPAGNSVAAMNLLRLARMTGRTEYEDRVDALLRAVAPEVAPVPSAHAHLMSAVDFAAGPSHEVVIAGAPGAEDTRAMLRALGGRYLPTKVVLLRPEPEDAPEIARLAPFTASQRAVGGRATAYVCQNFACEAPTTEIARMLESLKPKRTEMLREDPKQ